MRDGTRTRAALNNAVCTVTVAATSILLGLVATQVRPSLDAIVLLATAFVLLAPVALRVAQRRFDPFEPVVIFALAFGTMFVVRPTAMLIENNFVYERSSRTIAINDTYSEAIMLGAIGAVAFVGGYALPLGRRLAARVGIRSRSYRVSHVAAGAIATAAVGLVLTTLFLSTAGESLGLIFSGRSTHLSAIHRSSSAYLSHGPYLLVPSALVLFALARAHGRRGLLLVAALITVVLLLLTVPTGSRMLLLPFVGGAVVYRYVSRGKRPTALVLVALASASLFASVLLLDARSANGSFTDAATSTFSNPEQVLAPVTRDADAEMAPALAAALKVVPEEVGYMRGGATIGDLLTRPIPRELWDSKPLSPREQIISRLWPAEYLDGVANPEFSALLYFYLDFGVVGVLLGLGLYGVAARLIYEYYVRCSDEITARLVFALAIPFIVIALRDSPVDTFMRSVFVIAPVVAVFRLASRPGLAARDDDLRRVPVLSG